MKLKAYLKQHSLSVESFSKLIDVPSSTIYGWLSGKITPKSETAKKIVEVTKGSVSYQDLYDLSDDSN